jgi:N-acetylmuramoyl-L-alanine amidase
MKTLNISSRKHSLTRKIFNIGGVVLILFSLLTNIFISQVQNASADSPCGDTYIVLPGDTIDSIAALCGTTVDAILEINPEITDPDILYPGQIIRIPEIESIISSIITIGPTCGLPGQTLMVVGSGYPIGVPVDLKLTQQGGNTFSVGTTTSDQLGMIDTTIILPNSVQPGTAWFVSGDAQVSSAKFTSSSNLFHVIPKAGNPNAASTYVVQESDTLRSVAVKFNRDLESLFDANPQITETGQVRAGDVINIPPQEPGTPITTLTPICGPVETDLLVNGTGFPPVTTINLSMGPYLVSYQPVSTTSSSPSRTFQTLLTIPETAQVGENWVVIASTVGFSSVRSTSNIFIITPPNDPSEPSLYIVKPGDTLNEIAAEYTRTVSSILVVNPQINNPNQLEIGEKIIIPGQVQNILISPTSGPAQTVTQVAGIGFPPFSAVTLASTRDGVIISIFRAVNTDVNGFFSTDYIIPPSAKPGEIWNVVALKSDATGGEIIAKSNDFKVAEVQPLLQPALTIWPMDGSPGTSISVVGSTYPSLSKIFYTFGTEDDPTSISGTTWTEINGTFAVDLDIPISANPGDGWIVSAEAIENQAVSAVSPTFTVTIP